VNHVSGRVRPSYYNLTTELPSGQLILYNTKTGSLVVVDSDQKGDVLAALQGSVDRSAGVHVDTLVVSDTSLIHITLLPAEACIFACPYCFQFNRRNILMKPWVYEPKNSFVGAYRCPCQRPDFTGVYHGGGVGKRGGIRDSNVSDGPSVPPRVCGPALTRSGGLPHLSRLWCHYEEHNLRRRDEPHAGRTCCRPRDVILQGAA
jgi:hypothetical protein